MVRATVLLVDDDEHLWWLYEETLRGVDDIEVRIKGSVAEAQELLPQLLRSGIMVIAILDGKIRREMGETLAGEMRQKWQEAGKGGDLAIIACTGEGKPPTWGDPGCNFTKPFDHRELRACVCLQLRKVQPSASSTRSRFER